MTEGGPKSQGDLFARAVAADEAKDVSAAWDGYRHILTLDAAHIGALSNLGRLARSQGRVDLALDLYARAAEIDAAPPEVHFNFGCALADINDGTDCATAAIAAFDRALDLRPDFAVALRRRAEAITGQSDPEASVKAWNLAIARLPEAADLPLHAGVALMNAHQPNAAKAFLLRAAADPAQAIEAETRLADILMAQGDAQGAITLLRRLAGGVTPAPALIQNLAVALRSTGRYAEALRLFEKVADIAPGVPLVAVDRAVCLFNLGRIDEARPVFDAILRRGSPPEGMSAALMASLYDPDLSGADIRAQHEQAMQGQAHRAPLCRAIPPVPQDGTLKVGFVSADMSQNHPVAQFVIPLLGLLPMHGIAVTLYLTSKGLDETAEALHRVAQLRVVDLTGMSDADAAARIAADTQHLLIDLSGQTARNRLAVFGHRPAAVQASFVGYPSTTGHPAIDVLVADALTIPKALDGLYSETVFRLPNAFLCFVPPPGMPAPVIRRSGRLRLGSLNHLPKLNGTLLSLWGRVMAALPEAELFLKCAAFAEPDTRAVTIAALARLGIDPSRVILEGPSVFGDAMQSYCDIDIALDPTPYNGGTTTCHALWMGTPVISLAGERFSARMGASILTAAGHPEWVADSEDAYVAQVSELARDLPQLRASRLALAHHVRRSALCDIDLYGRDVAGLLRDIVTWARQRPLVRPGLETPLAFMPQTQPTATNPRTRPERAPVMPHDAETPDLPASQTETPRFEITTSRQFESFLFDTGAALAISTYQAGMVLFVGIDPLTKRLSIFNRHIERPMGLACDRNRLVVASLTQIVTFINGHQSTDADAKDPVYVPQMGHFTGDLDVHDLAFASTGEVVFVNTLFSCLAKVSDTHSFRPVWKPPFISMLAAEDRCHLNGLALRDGTPAFVTAVSQSNIADGWREHRRDGGIVMDVATNEVVASGLSMPHSPRWHDGKLWILNAGSGEIGTVNLDTGAFEPVAFCPGYLRGLTFIGGFALVGASEPRGNKAFEGLALQDRLDKERVSPRCGLFVIDLTTGDVVHWLRIEGVVTELFDIAVIPSARKPTMIGFKSDEIRRVVSIGPVATL